MDSLKIYSGVAEIESRDFDEENTIKEYSGNQGEVSYEWEYDAVTILWKITSETNLTLVNGKFQLLH